MGEKTKSEINYDEVRSKTCHNCINYVREGFLSWGFCEILKEGKLEVCKIVYEYGICDYFTLKE